MANPAFVYHPPDFGDEDPVKGSVMYYNGSAWVPLPPGNDGEVLITNGSDGNPTWVVVSLPSDFDLAGAVEGSIIYYNGTDWVDLPPGSVGQVMNVGATTIPQWSNQFLPSDWDLAGAAAGATIYNNGTNWIDLALGTTGQTIVAGASAPAWGTDVVGGNGTTSAAAGFKGQYVESVVATGSAVGAAFASTEYGNVASVSLTAGDWDVSGLLHVQAGTFTVLSAAVSIFSANTTTDHVVGSNVVISVQTSAADLAVPVYRLLLTGTTTVYLKGAVTGVPSNNLSGRLSARRIR